MSGASTSRGTPSTGRRRQGRRIAEVSLSLLAVFVLALVAFTATSAAAKKPPKKPAKPKLVEPQHPPACGSQNIQIAYVSALANTYGQAIEKGLRAFLSTCPNVKVVDFDTGFDSQKEFNTIEDITTQGTFQGIAFLPLDAVGVIPAVQDAVKHGVQIVNFNNPVGNDYATVTPHIPGMAGTVLEPQYKRGIWLAQMSAQACKGISNCQVGFIGGGASSAEVAIKLGFLKGMKAHKNMHMVAYSLNGQYLPGPSVTVAEDMLQAHHGMNVITGSGDQMMRGAEIAIDNAGLQKQVKIVGLGGSKIAVAAVKAGKWFGTVVTQPLDQGRLTGWVLMRHILNPKLPAQGINPFTYTHRTPLLTKPVLDKTHFVAQWTG
jgi:ribose transport system substrate-binding protein